MAARPITEIPQEGKWIEPVSSSTGVSIGVLQQLVDLADAGGLDGNTVEVMSALMGWLTSRPLLLMDFIRPESLEGLFGDAYKKLPDDEHRAREALAKIVILLPLWMSGAPLNQLEAAYSASTDKLGRCEHARHFVSRVVPEIAFLAGLPARLVVARGKHIAAPPLVQTVLATLGGIVREGCDSPEALATRLNCGRSVSRVAARQIFEKIRGFASSGTSAEDFENTRERMRQAAI